MAETPQQYIQRILGHVAEQEPLQVQAGTASRLEQLMNSAPTAKLRERPAPDKWSVGEILPHLAETEIVISWRVRSILAAPGTPIQPFDQDAWVVAGHYSKRDPNKSLAQFRMLREANLDLYASLSPEQWERY